MREEEAEKKAIGSGKYEVVRAYNHPDSSPSPSLPSHVDDRPVRALVLALGRLIDFLLEILGRVIVVGELRCSPMPVR